MRAGAWRGTANALRLCAAVAVLAVLVARLGTGPFVQAVTGLSAPAVLVTVLVTAVSTTCCAARWVWVAERLGLSLDLRTAVGACYRSQMINQALPGGVLGDVQRAVRQRAVRAVAWERVLGQVALLGLAAVVLLAVPSPVPRGVVATGAGLLVGAVLVATRFRLRIGATPLVEADLWWPLALSVLAVGCHVSVLLVALRLVAPDAGVASALPLLVAVLVASSLPVNVAGWGPREGAAAWLFALAGLGAATGVSVAATYGALSLLATAPGAALLVADVLPRREVATT